MRDLIRGFDFRLLDVDHPKTETDFRAQLLERHHLDALEAGHHAVEAQHQGDGHRRRVPARRAKSGHQLWADQHAPRDVDLGRTADPGNADCS